MFKQANVPTFRLVPTFQEGLFPEAEITPEMRRSMMEAFGAADKNGDGVLSVDEYCEIFHSHGLSIGEQ